jgi:broad specificity phosphatase PhoE
VNDSSVADKTTLYLVRHGETDWNANGRCQGCVDVPLNAAGLAQARELTDRLTDVPIDAAYTSPLIRARATATEILRPHHLRAVGVPELVELSYGDFQGTASTSWDDAIRTAWQDAPWSVTFPNGESLAMAQARAIPVLERIVTAHPGEPVLVVGHGHVNRLLMLHLLGRGLEDFWTIEQPNGALLTLRVTHHGVVA